MRSPPPSHAARRAPPRTIGFLLVAVVAMGLAGCGRRGPLLPPPGTPESQAAPPLPETQTDYFETGTPGYAEGPVSNGTQSMPPPSQQTKAKPPVTPQAGKNTTFFLDPLL